MCTSVFLHGCWGCKLKSSCLYSTLLSERHLLGAQYSCFWWHGFTSLSEPASCYTDENGSSTCAELSLYMEAVDRFSMPCLDIKALPKIFSPQTRNHWPERYLINWVIISLKKLICPIVFPANERGYWALRLLRKLPNLTHLPWVL